MEMANASGGAGGVALLSFLELTGTDAGKLLKFPVIVGLIAVAQDLGCLRLSVNAGLERGKQSERILEAGLPAQLFGADPHLTGDDLLQPAGGIEGLLFQIFNPQSAAVRPNQMDRLIGQILLLL